MSDDVRLVGLADAPLDEAALADLASAQQLVAAPGELSQVAHLLPPSVRPDAVAGGLDALVQAAVAAEGAVAVVVPAGKDLWRAADRLAGVLGMEALRVHPGEASLTETLSAAGKKAPSAGHDPGPATHEPESATADDRDSDRASTTATGRVTVVGVAAHAAAGDPAAALPPHARQALASATLVAGAQRHLDHLGALLPADARRLALTGELGGALDEVAAWRGPAVVLASGDPGFFGILRALTERADPADPRGGPLRPHVIPAVSSVAAVFAAAGVSWDDAVVVSAHGRDPAYAASICRRFPKVAVLTAPDFGPADLADALGGHPRRWIVGERLGTPQARITSYSPHLDERDWDEPNVVAVIDEAVPVAAKGRAFPARRIPSRWALPNEAFAHRDGMITKPDVRAAALARLGPGMGDLVWDVGAGSGAVAVEAARLGAAVIAVDADPEQSARTAGNAERHGVPVDVVTARAPDALDDLPDPDAVFVGGGGHLLTEIVRRAADRTRRVVVVALVTLERITPVQRALVDAGLHVDGTMLQSARIQALGSGHRLAADNAVFLLEGRRSETAT